MPIEVDFKIVKINKTAGTLAVRYFVVGSPQYSLEYQYEIPVIDGVPCTPEAMLQILALRKPVDDLTKLSNSVEMDLDAFDAFIVPDPEPVVEDPVPLTFAEQLAALIKAVDQKAKEIRNAVMSDYSAFEAASWSIKLAEAKVVASTASSLSPEMLATWDFSAAAPLLSPEASARGISVVALAQKVLSNGAAYSDIEALIAGYSGNLADRLRSVPDGDMEALLAIDIESEWPVL